MSHRLTFRLTFRPTDIDYEGKVNDPTGAGDVPLARPNVRGITTDAIRVVRTTAASST